ncbi:lantibiotic dehydratase [Mucilaginibacter sp. FT3.2]|uniref:lantibiotic dehydratase n=1 Tax=Mucilaginibacter sp. FT3.2 TaxID=2723090 RepID=UPI00160B2012|nr:lantibiotic dehydratase [Mucilaginibacter sp. FT3.2]MBB6230656.1 thiopeptide-type bacteriocin biosynthesis protein [Mucilaginibacter sp. FT3.2]
MPYDPSFIERSPAFYSRKYTPGNIQKYLSDRYFQFALRLASVALYTEIGKKVRAGLPLSQKESFSIKKYINRIHFRATPFGLYSIVGAGNWQASMAGEKYMGNGDALSVQMVTPLQLGSVVYKDVVVANGSGYLINKEIRFLSYSKTNEGSLKWTIKSMGAPVQIKKIWSFCQQERTVAVLEAYIAKQFNSTADDAREILQILTDNQVLYFKDHSSPLNYSGQKIDSLTGTTDWLLQQFSSIHQNQLNGIVVNTFKSEHSQLSDGYLKNIDDALLCLQFLSTGDQVPGALNEFIIKFEKKYDRRLVPLLEALDPELGIGYDEAALGDVQLNEIVQHVSFQQNGLHAAPKVLWTAIHSLLLKKMQTGGNIEIFENEIKETPAVKAKAAPSMAIVFRIDNEDRVVIENVGGVTGTSLIGRFTSYPSINEVAKRIANHEVTNNPDVIFAEINCRTEEKYDKFNFRNNNYPYQLCIGYHGTNPDQISLNDIYLYYSDGEVQLFSKKLSARIIPRLSSAYNYKLNELPVYRFLCDMQFPGVKHHYTFSLKNYFPGLVYYPAIVYKKVVLEPASWEFDTKITAKFKNQPPDKAMLLLHNLIRQFNLPNQVRIMEADQYLVFDLLVDAERLFFIECLQHTTGLVILQEFNFIAGEGRHNTGLKQFIAFKYADKESYPKPPLPNLRPKVIRHLEEVNEWLYLKIYCHPNSANQIMSGHLAPLVEALVPKGLKQWFFINYYDPEYHIRFRLNFNNKYINAHVQSELAAIYKLERSGVIKKIDIQSYMPEYERYGFRQMRKAENVFYRDSEYCLYLLFNSDLFRPEFLYLTILSVHLVYEHLKWELKKRIDFSENLAVINTDDDKEMASFFRQSNQLYRQYEKPLRSYFLENNETLSSTIYLRNYHQALSAYIKAMPANKKDIIMGDIFHMHLNRLFTSSNHLHEAMVHHWLFKFYKSLAHAK